MSVEHLPHHLAIIMDGNGRWARDRGMCRSEGHRRGARNIREVVTRCRQLGIRYLTLYAFSCENWARPPSEVHALMRLLSRFLDAELITLRRNRVELAAIGELDHLPVMVRRRLERAMAATRGLNGMRLTLALSYGGRQELTRAVRRLMLEVSEGKLSAPMIDEQEISNRLDTSGTPDPDLVIRTGGERRLSNFLLWQVAYAELYFADVAWPDFGRDELSRAMQWFAGRQRRFGLLVPCLENPDALYGGHRGP